MGGRLFLAITLSTCLLSCPGARRTPADASPWLPVGDGTDDTQPEQRAMDGPPDHPLTLDRGALADSPLKPDAPPQVDSLGCTALGQGCASAACCSPLACSGAGTTCCRPVGQACLAVAECCAGRACVLQKCCVIVGDGCSQDAQCCNFPAHQCQMGTCCVVAGSGCSSDPQCCSGQCQLGTCT
jgi:hypothetical protein